LSGTGGADNDGVMKKHVLAVVVVALVAVVIAGLNQPASADANRFRAFVYPDRTQPDLAVVVDDFRVNETIWDYGGVQYLWIHGPAGNFKVALGDVSQIEVVKYLGPTQAQADWMRYEVKVSGKEPGVVHTGTMDIRVYRGVADGAAWYYYPATQKDRGRGFWRITFGPDRIDPTLPREEPKPEAVPVAIVPPPAAPAPRKDTEEDIFARMSLQELNAQAPLSDIFYDFDKSAVRPDGEAVLQRNLAWLKRWTSTQIQIEGYADPRGTQEYNVGLGQRRAEAARQFLVAAGIPASRLTMVSRGPSQVFCAEHTEECWARNRRAHFVITAK
jgi:peptidoglycan-associated lipoprotein